MATPAFGFSVGDFIATINLVIKISKALRDTNGAATEIKDLLQELQHLELLLEQLKDLPPESSPSPSHLNAVRGMALSVQIPLRAFLGKMEKYKEAATSQSRSNLLRGVGRKVQWTVTMQEDIAQLRAVITMKIVSVSVLLAMPTGKQLYRIQQSVVENRGVIEDARQGIQEARAQLSQDICETKNEIRRAGNKTRLDTHRLLKICAGLYVGVERLEKQRRLEFESRQREMSYGPAILAGTVQIQSSVNTLRLSISHSIILLRQLLQRFSNFSQEIVEHLKQLHLSNVEIYLLLRRILERIPLAPSGFLADDIRFVDVLQREWRLPYAIFSEFEIFEKMLQCKFKGLPGESKVLQGEYHVMNTKPPYQIIPRQEWNRFIWPGSSLDMSILLVEFRSSGGRCPRVACSGTGALDALTGMLTCPVCNLQYFQVQMELDEKEDAPKIDQGRASVNNSPLGRGTEETQQQQPDLWDSWDSSTNALSPQTRKTTFRVPTQLQIISELLQDFEKEQEDRKKKSLDELSVFRKVHVQLGKASQDVKIVYKSSEKETEIEAKQSIFIGFVEKEGSNSMGEWNLTYHSSEWNLTYQSSKSIGLRNDMESPLFQNNFSTAEERGLRRQSPKIISVTRVSNGRTRVRSKVYIYGRPPPF